MPPLPFRPELHVDLATSDPLERLVVRARRAVGDQPVGIRAGRLAPDRVRLILEAETPSVLDSAWARLGLHRAADKVRLVAP